MVTAFQFFTNYLIVDTLCAVLTIIIASNVSRDSGSETQVRYFFLVLTAYLAFTVFDAIWALVAYSDLVTVSDAVLSLVNCLSLTAIGFAAYFWLCFTLARFNSKVTDNRKLRMLLALPAVLVPVIHIIGAFTNENVITLPDGSWTYGICHLTITCVHLLYILAATIVAAQRYRHTSSRTERHLSLVFISFMVPFVVAGIVDTIIINTPVVTACIIVSLVFVMMSMQETRISTDALTGLNNRRRANEFLESSMTHVSSGKPLYVLAIDINDFKNVNDTYGHLEGDRALKLMADSLRHACSQINAFAARMGGDEFIIICTEASDENTPERAARIVEDALADQIREAKLPYPLTCSIGYAICESSTESQSDLFNRADKMLYKVKRAHNAQR